jgi:hypothetical protein
MASSADWAAELAWLRKQRQLSHRLATGERDQLAKAEELDEEERAQKEHLRRRAAHPDPRGVIPQGEKYASECRAGARHFRFLHALTARRRAPRRGHVGAQRRPAGRPRARALARASSRSADSGSDPDEPPRHRPPSQLLGAVA